MKTFKKSIIAIALILFGFNSSAQIYGGITLFEVASASLDNGKIKIESASSTTFKFRVKFSRPLNSQWYPGSGVEKYLFSNFTIRLSTPNASGGVVTLSDEETVTNADFGTDSLFVSKVYEVTINKSDLKTGNNIFLNYKPASYLYSNYSKSYGWVLNGGSTTPPTTPWPRNPWWFNGIQRVAIPTYPINTPIWVPSAVPVLTKGNSIYTANGAYFIALQPDGNLVIYRSSNWQVLWDSGSTNKGGENLYFQPDGNLVLRKSTGEAVWASNIYSNSPSYSSDNVRFVFQDDGNLVMQFVNLPNNFIEIVGESQTYNRVSSHWGSLKF